ncbi:MAG: hypothetical protein ABI672_06975 [Vicinamibacteria bacterium]
MSQETKLGVAPNVAGLLCYVPCGIGGVFSVVAALVETENRFVRFHAFQSLLLHAVAFALGFGYQVASAILYAFLPWSLYNLWRLVGLLAFGAVVAFLALLIVLMVRANSNHEFKLPVIGNLAAKWAGDPASRT